MICAAETCCKQQEAPSLVDADAIDFSSQREENGLVQIIRLTFKGARWIVINFVLAHELECAKDSAHAKLTLALN